MKPPLRERAHGRWRDILSRLGVDAKFLKNKHGPCPVCDGDDRFRWDNKDGTGSFFCSHCNPGDGFTLLQNLHGWDFHTTAVEVEKVIGDAKVQKVKDGPSDADMLEWRRSLYRASVPMQPDDLAGRYLASRDVLPDHIPPDLRFVSECRATDGVLRPAMIAVVRSVNGEVVNLHRTFLSEAGKADMPDPRAVMPGGLPDGCAVRLWPCNKVLGIAEGIETALWAMKLFKVPVWSAINANRLATFIAPEGVERLLVFGDNDPKFGGQAAAYQCAHRNACRKGGPTTEVHVPDVVGTDWADAA